MPGLAALPPAPLAAAHVLHPWPARPALRSAMLTVSRTYLEIPVIIHEFGTAALPPGQLGELEKINQRARLYRTRMPPDQLNPDGCVPCRRGLARA